MSSLLRKLGVHSRLEAVALAMSPALFAQAQSYPTRPVRLIVPASTGTGMDHMGRSLAQVMSEQYKQQVIIDNFIGEFIKKNPVSDADVQKEYDRAKVFDLVKRREERGWTFAYLGANQDAYAEGDKVGVAKGSTQAWAASPAGSRPCSRGPHSMTLR